MPEAKPKVNCPAIAADDEADKGPATFRLEATLDEAEEINPETVSRLAKLVAPETDNVDEAERGPAIERLAAIEEVAEEMKPPLEIVKRLPKLATPVTEMPPVRVRLVAITVPVANKPPTVEVPETRELPWTARMLVVAEVVVPRPKILPSPEVR